MFYEAYTFAYGLGQGLYYTASDAAAAQPEPQAPAPAAQPQAPAPEPNAPRPLPSEIPADQRTFPWRRFGTHVGGMGTSDQAQTFLPSRALFLQQWRPAWRRDCSRCLETLVPVKSDVHIFENAIDVEGLLHVSTASFLNTTTLATEGDVDTFLQDPQNQYCTMLELRTRWWRKFVLRSLSSLPTGTLLPTQCAFSLPFASYAKKEPGGSVNTFTSCVIRVAGTKSGLLSSEN